MFDATFNNPTHGKVRPKRRDSCRMLNLTNSSESQSASMLLGRRNNPQFNVVLSKTTPLRILLGPQIIHRFCLA